jgi:oxygen-independent coproporphyrinogen III oxidase
VTPRHLYVHVPFCVRRCSYCDFAVSVQAKPSADTWLAAVATELAMHRNAAGWPRLQWDTLYVGGGTPSLLEPDAMHQLLERLAPEGRLADAAEWTCEANPESLNSDLATAWAAAGVNRVSIGVQTFHEPALRWMGRLHGEAGAGRAMAAVRAGGIENVSVDLIFGLPDRLGRDWSADLDRAIALEPDHVSLYGLTAEPATPLGRWVGEGREQLADEDRYAEEYLLAAEKLGAAGFVHYEVSNFARPGRESRHNRAYWNGSAYIGLGPGAHSFVPPRRFWNTRDWFEYRQRVFASGIAVEGDERVGEQTASLEAAWLGLRSNEGVPVAGLTEGQSLLVRRWRELEWATVGDGRVRLTAAGWLLLDRLSVELSQRAG